MPRAAAADLPPVVYERYPGAAAAPLPAAQAASAAPEPATRAAHPSASYYRRRPERTALYEAVRAHLETFLAEAASASGPGGSGYPRFVEHEFRRFLDCGIPAAKGFARLRCPDCGHERIVAYSCKGRCLCPSCMGRRMAAIAAELVDQRLPAVPYRQWVFTFPFALRFALAANPRFLSAVLGAFLATLFAWMRRRAELLALDPRQLQDAVLLPKTASAPLASAPLASAPLASAPLASAQVACPQTSSASPGHLDIPPEDAPGFEAVSGLTGPDPIDLTRVDFNQARPGSVSFLQRFGGALNLNPHGHAIVTDGIFVPADASDPDSPLLYIELPPPTDLDVRELLHDIAIRVLAIARRFHLPELTLRSLERELGARHRPSDTRGEHATDDDDNDDDLIDPPSEDSTGNDDPQQALLEQTLAHALRPPLCPAPPSREPSTDPDALKLPFSEEQHGLFSPLSAHVNDLPPHLCARRAGFSLHAARTVETHDRDGLERLCRYGLRPPFSAERLSILPDGRLRYTLRKPWPTPDGQTKDELILDPIDFLRRLAALVPPPYFNTVRYHGVLAARHKLHQRLPLPPPPAPATQGLPSGDHCAPVSQQTARSAPGSGAHHVEPPAVIASPQSLLPLTATVCDTRGAANDLTVKGHPDARSESHRTHSRTSANTETEPRPITRKRRTSAPKHSRGRTGWAAPAGPPCSCAQWTSTP